MVEPWQHLDHTSNQPALISAAATVTWKSWLELIGQDNCTFSEFQSKRVGLQLPAHHEAIARFLSLTSLGAHVFLFAADLDDARLAEWSESYGVGTMLKSDGTRIDFEHAARDGTAGGVTVLTSGTTGKPKAAQHSWQSLTRPVRVDPKFAGQRWLLTYRPHLYAGLQVMMQCLLNQGTLILPSAEGNAEEVAQLAAEQAVEFASATPSYWRWLLTFAESDTITRIPLQQITLGGEAVDQATLNVLEERFPNTRIVHIYATTELGRCFSVTDGCAGFPRQYLESTTNDGIELKIDDGELVVRSKNAMHRYDGKGESSTQEEWFRTGDLVRIDGDRVNFVGRKSEMINVGGNKVYPVEVENVIRTVAGISDVRVYAESSSIVGELVKCDLVILDGFQANDVCAAVREITQTELATYQRPRFLNVVERIPKTIAGKIDRG